MAFDLHPQIVHFPIVLITVSLILHLIHVVRRSGQISTMPFYFSISGLVTGFAAAISGESAEETVTAVNATAFEAIERHEFFANMTLWILLPLLIAWGFYIGEKRYSRKFEILILAALAVLTVTVTITGHLGGRLVYIFGIGIDLP